MAENTNQNASGNPVNSGSFGGGQGSFGGGQGGSFGGGQGGFGGGQGGESPMGSGGGPVSPFAQLRMNIDNYFLSDDFNEGRQPGNLNPFSQPPSGGAGGQQGGANPFGGNPFEYDPTGGADDKSDNNDSDDKDQPMMGDNKSDNNDSDNQEQPIMSDNRENTSTNNNNPFAGGENPFQDFSNNLETGRTQYENFSQFLNEFGASTGTEGDDSDNLFAGVENPFEGSSDYLETAQQQYQNFSEFLSQFQGSSDGEGDNLAPFPSFLNALSESDLELPEGSPITDRSQFSELAANFSELASSNLNTFIETFSDVDFTGGSGSPFIQGNPFAGEENPIVELFTGNSDSSAI